ncbi:hypothetical protein ACHAQI_004647 [Fusarium lateritium]
MPTWSFAPLRRIKRELSPDTGQALDNAPSKRQEVEGNAVAPKLAEFPWTTCDNRGNTERLKLKEDALKIAETACTKVRKELESAISQVEKERPSEGLVIGGQEKIKEWMESHDKLRETHRNLRILVGVEGPTGAGKSSFLDSLLRTQELFPSGHQGAATAVVGKVSWNWDDAPGHRFRAKVTFRKKADIENSLESLFEDLKSYSDLENFIQAHLNDAEATEARDTVNFRIKYEMAKVKAVFGLTREDLMAVVKRKGNVASYKPLVQWLLDKNPRAHLYLRLGSIEFKSPTLSSIRLDVKPFLTSRSSKFGSDRAFAIWPLVEDVHMFVKSEILKSGMTLVDLPGCSDSTACRSEVAKKFSHLLDVRLVVSPIVRAADEKQGQVLMQSGFDEAQMKIRGKYDGYGFGIVLSKTDQLPVHRYLEDFLQDHDEPETRAKLTEFKALEQRNVKLKSKVLELIKRVQAAKKEEMRTRDAHSEATENSLDQSQGDAELHQKYLKKLQAKAIHSFKVLGKGQKILESHTAQAQILSQEIYDVDSWLHVKAFDERNCVVKKQIQENYAARQKELNRSDQVNHTLPMFPVSSDAFWHWDKTGCPCKGYPSIEATGVPAAEKWLQEATLSKREHHLDVTLTDYHKLMNIMILYSQETGRAADYGVTRSSIEDALASIHQTVAANLSMRISAASSAIDNLNPLANRKMASRQFSVDAHRVSKNFANKYPGKERSGKMHCATYGAIMRRHGQPYTSGGEEPTTYTWGEDLSALALRPISKEWDEDMNQKRRKIETDIVKAFKDEWKNYPKKVENLIRGQFPMLELSFNGLIQMMSNVERTAQNDIRSIMEALSREASNVVEESTAFLVEQLGPIFDAGLQITGDGSYKKRQKHNESSIERNSQTMSEELLSNSDERLKERFVNTKTQLNGVAGEAIKSVKQQVSLLIDNLVDNCPADNDMKVKKLELQKKIRARLGEWEQAWRQQEIRDEASSSGPSASTVKVEINDLDEDAEGEDDDEDNLEDPFMEFEDDAME